MGKETEKIDEVPSLSGNKPLLRDAGIFCPFWRRVLLAVLEGAEVEEGWQRQLTGDSLAEVQKEGAN